MMSNPHMSDDQTKKLTLAPRILRWGIFAAFIVACYMFRAKLAPALAPFLYALLLTYLLAPLVAMLEKRKFSRTMAIFAVYLFLIGLLVLLGIYVIPTIVSQINSLTKQVAVFSVRAQELLQRLETEYSLINLPPMLVDPLESAFISLQGALTSLFNFLAQFIVNLFSSAVVIILVPILSFYMLKDMEALQSRFLSFFPNRQQKLVLDLSRRIDSKLGAWVRGQVTICLITGGLIFVGLSLVGMDYALVFGFLVAVFNIIPYFGPLIAAVPAILLALLRSPTLGLKVMLVQAIVQHFESTIIVPNVLGKELGLHPLVIIFALLLGAQLAGVLGMVLAAPVAAILLDLFNFWRERKATPEKLTSDG